MKNIKRSVAVILSLVIIMTGICWYKTPITEVHAETETEYNSDMLSLKFQKGITEATTDKIRVVASVDSPNYSAVGFAIDKGDGTGATEYTINTKQYPLPQRIASSVEGLEYTFSPKVIDASGEYFLTAKWTAVESIKYTVCAWVKTFEGEKIYGQSRCISLDDFTTEYLNMSFELEEDCTLPLSENDETTYADIVVTYNNAETTAKVISVKGSTVHVNVQGVNHETLPSATKFVFKSNDKNTEYGSSIFRNLYTEYSETTVDEVTANTADTSWYDVYLAEDSSEDEFVIATNADMYGFMHLMNGTTTDNTREVFSGKTVYLVSDIELNDVEEGVTATAWAQADVDGTTLTTMPYRWMTDCTADNSSTHFAGTFDGQMHTISGVYMKETTAGVGLFGITASTSVVKNFYLTESYFTTTYNSENAASNTNMILGSVVGRCRGTVDSVYSDAIVQTMHAKGRRLGGIVGLLETQNDDDNPATINNCWFAGEVRLIYQYGGGIAGYIYGYTTNIQNSLFTGKISSPTDDTKCNYVGGIAGLNEGATCNIEDSISAGTITAGESSVGSIFARVMNEGEYRLINAYGITQDGVSISGTVEAATTDDDGTVTEAASVAENRGYGFSDITSVQGAAAYQNTLLDFEDVWCARTGDVPALQIFRHKINKDTTIELSEYEQNKWYDEDADADNVVATKYRIHSLSAFEAFRDYVNDGTTFSGMEVYLATDIDMNPGWTAEIDETTGALTTVPNNSWTPIGTESSKSFQGSLFGEGYTINGIYTDGSAVYNGLFGYLGAGSSVSNLQIVNSYISCGDASSQAKYGGTLAGAWYGGTVNNLYSDAYVIGAASADYNSCYGGIVGMLGNASVSKTMTKCWFDGDVYQTKDVSSGTKYSGVGGLIGRLSQGNVVVTDCLNTGVLKTNASIMPCIGGILGWTSSNTTTVQIKRCLNLGDIKIPNRTSQTGCAAIIGSAYAGSATTCTATIQDSLWLKGDSFNASYEGYGHISNKATVTASNSTQYDNLSELCEARTSQTDEAKYLGFVGLAEDDVTPAYLYMNVNGTTTGMNNVVDNEADAKDCIILNDFKDWWLEYHGLEEEVYNLLMIGNSFCSYYVEELYGLAEAAGINMAVYNVYASGCPVSQYVQSLEAEAKGETSFKAIHGGSEYQVAGFDFRVTASSEGKQNVINDQVSLNYCLDYAEWDAISLQSGRQQQYIDYDILEELNLTYAKYLYDYIRDKHPDARLLWHHAWEYEVGYTKAMSESVDSTGDGGDESHAVPTRANQIERHRVNRLLAQKIATDNSVDIVSTGDAWELLREVYYPTVGTDVDSTEDITVNNRGNYKHLCANPDKYTVYKNNALNALEETEWSGTTAQIEAALPYAEEYGDMYHDGSIGGGQYLNACVWFEVLTGKSCVGNRYLPTYTFIKNSGDISKTYQMYYDSSTETEEGVTRTNYDASILQSYAHQAVEELKTQVELFTNVRSITQGAARVTLEADGIHFYRFTEEQHASVDERCTIAVQDATAGVRLHFKTDSENLTLKVRTSEGVASDHNKTKQFSHDIYVNGELKYELKGEGNEWSELYGDYVGTYELGEGTKEVCIYFPWSVCSVLTGFSLDEGSSLEPMTKDKTVVFYGDSITNGRDVSNPSMHYTAKLAEALNATWINKGVSGDVFRPAFAEMKDDVEPDYIVVAYGTNHFKSGKVGDVTTKIQSFYDNLVKTYPNALIFAVTPIWRSNADTAQTEFQNLWEISAIIEDAAEQYDNVIAIDGTDFVPHDAAYYSDGLHPNDAGFEQYSPLIIEAINTILASNQ